MLIYPLLNALRIAGRALSHAWRRHQAWLELRRLGSADLKDMGLGSGDAWSAAEAYGRGEDYRCNGLFVDRKISEHQRIRGSVPTVACKA